MTGNLDTTNLILGVIAAVSVLQALLIIGVGVVGWRLYSQAMKTVREVEARQVAPLVARVNALITRVDGLMVKVDGILVDVKGISSRVGERTERVDTAINDTMDRVDETARKMRSSVVQRVGHLFEIISSARETVGTLFNGNGRRDSADAPGHASIT